mmetsp:Transcript_8339/g.24658  ORF Transcript_8339/g.24658 Transcript_8339/m.24658 type:complete len:334 (+) Transcript_8339:525-1526(+)
MVLQQAARCQLLGLQGRLDAIQRCRRGGGQQSRERGRPERHAEGQLAVVNVVIVVTVIIVIRVIRVAVDDARPLVLEKFVGPDHDHPVRNVGRQRDRKAPQERHGSLVANHLPEGVRQSLVVPQLQPLLDRIEGTQHQVVAKDGGTPRQCAPPGRHVAVLVAGGGLDDFVRAEIEGVGGDATDQNGLDAPPQPGHVGGSRLGRCRFRGHGRPGCGRGCSGGGRGYHGPLGDELADGLEHGEIVCLDRQLRCRCLGLADHSRGIRRRSSRRRRRSRLLEYRSGRRLLELVGRHGCRLGRGVVGCRIVIAGGADLDVGSHRVQWIDQYVFGNPRQ